MLTWATITGVSTSVRVFSAFPLVFAQWAMAEDKPKLWTKSETLQRWRDINGYENELIQGINWALFISQKCQVVHTSQGLRYADSLGLVVTLLVTTTSEGSAGVCWYHTIWYHTIWHHTIWHHTICPPCNRKHTNLWGGGGDLSFSWVTVILCVKPDEAV